MWLHASCFLEFNIPVPTPFVLMLRPRSGMAAMGRERTVRFVTQRTGGRVHRYRSATCVSGWSHLPGILPFIHPLTSKPLTHPTQPLGPRLSKCNSCPMRHYRSFSRAGIVNRIVSLKWPHRSLRAEPPATTNVLQSSIISATRYGTHLAPDSRSSVPPS
jgi:hypothetical protein